MTASTAPQRTRHVAYEHGGDGVARITLSRPEKLNAVHPPMMRDLTAAFAAFHTDDDALVAILSGAGRAFCAGADTAHAGRPAADPAEDLSRLPELFLAQRVPKPIVAAVQGPVIGMGLRMVLLADVAVCASDATFAAPEVSLGLDGGPYWWLLQARAGDAFAMHAVATGQSWDAAEAERRGIVTRCVAPGLVDATATDLARTLAARPRRALSALVGTRREALRDRELAAWRTRGRDLTHTTPDGG
ncbi:MAG: hypothetical protein ABS81_02575 [Pseudonocardia sp. SCN 72-86]|nr:MAG: hypothetical protein ABS81_02575 [Pseudonocardia sp. SCN 72-86]